MFEYIASLKCGDLTGKKTILMIKLMEYVGQKRKKTRSNTERTRMKEKWIFIVLLFWIRKSRRFMVQHQHRQQPQDEQPFRNYVRRFHVSISIQSIHTSNPKWINNRNQKRFSNPHTSTFTQDIANNKATENTERKKNFERQDKRMAMTATLRHCKKNSEMYT